MSTEHNRETVVRLLAEPYEAYLVIPESGGMRIAPCRLRGTAEVMQQFRGGVVMGREEFAKTYGGSN